MLLPACKLLRYGFLCTLCLLVCGCFAREPLVVRGPQHGVLVWEGEVFIAGDVILEEDVRLTILPGTRVRFVAPTGNEDTLIEHPHFPGSELIVKGQILAIGTASEPVVFEAADRSAAAGFWGAINLVGSQEAVFEYCVFRQADSAVHSWDSRVYIEQSVFENNLVAIRFNESDILIEHNLLRNNGTGIRFHFGAPVICENRFAGNRVNLFVTSHPRDYRIENNAFGVPVEYHVVFGEEVPDDVSMPRNFWEHQETDTPEKSFYDGRRTPYLGRVVIDPQRTAPTGKEGLSWTP